MFTNEETVRRLGILIDKLSSIGPEQYDHNHWECGTAKCAAGHACTIPEFRTLGLSMGASPQFNEHYGYWALAKFFELAYLDAYNIFSHDGYLWSPTIADVISRIQEVMAKYK